MHALECHLASPHAMDALDTFRPYQSLLWIVASVGLIGLNGVFVYYALVRPDLMTSALQNPISVVFLLEALLLTVFFTGVVWRFGAKKPGWVAFVIMSFVGSLAFSIPAFIALHLREKP